jgi:hypothetical protein
MLAEVNRVRNSNAFWPIAEDVAKSTIQALMLRALGNSPQLFPGRSG